MSMAPPRKKQRASSSNDKKVRHACAPRELVEVNKKLTEAQKAQIERTPFKWVVNMPENFQISSLLLSELATRWDQQYEGFRVGGSVVQFRPIDVCFALGLPIVGEELQADEREESSTLSLFGEDDVTIDEIVDKLVECVEDDVYNFCRLYMLLAFGEFYFPQSGRRVYSGYIKYLDNLESLHKYKWGQSVHQFVVASLNKVSSVVNEGKNLCETHLRGHAAVLQIWAFNHLSLGETPNMPHRFPFSRFLNWPIVRYKIKTIQDAFRQNVVTENLTATSEELQFDVVRDPLEDAEHQYVRVSEYRRLVVEHQQSQERIFILEADVKMLKDQLGSTTEPHDASLLIPAPHTDIADEVGDEGPLGIERGNADADALVSTPKERHGEAGVGDQEGNEDGEHSDKSNITTRVKENPRRHVQSVSTKSPFTHTYMTRKKRTAMQRATQETTKNA